MEAGGVRASGMALGSGVRSAPRPATSAACSFFSLSRRLSAWATLPALGAGAARSLDSSASI